MAKSWYLSLDGRQLGPLPSEQVQRMAARGQIKPETLIRPETQEQWLPAETWPQLFAGDKAAAAPAAVSTKRPSGTVPRAKAISVAPQPAPSPPTGTIPRGVPAGVAVTAPVGVPTGVAAKVPLGAAVQTAAPTSGSGFPPVIVADNSTARTKTGAVKSNEDGQRAPGKKSRTPVLVLGGAAIAIAIIGGVIVFANPFGGDGEKKPVATVGNSLAAAIKGPEADPDAAEGEAPVANRNANPAAAVLVPKLTDKGSAPPSSAKPVVNKDVEELKKKVKSWKTASAGYKIGSLQYQVTNVWLANDATDEAEAGKSVPVTAAESDKASSKPKHLFVQVVLRNVGTTPLAYRGWNGFSAKDTAAVLLGNENVPLPLAPIAEAATERLKSVSIAPQSAITDTLVFAAPSGETETLRLMLPKIAVTGIGAGVFALEIPSAMISLERPAENVLVGASTALAGKPAVKESEFERERRLLDESLGGEPENKPNEPKPKEPATSKGTPDAEMPADDKPGTVKSESKEAKPAEPDLKSLINGIEKKGDGDPKSDKPKGAEWIGRGARQCLRR